MGNIVLFPRSFSSARYATLMEKSREIQPDRLTRIILAILSWR